MKYAGAALNQTPIHWENNIRNIKAVITQAREANIDLLCLPELCITGYGCEDLFLSEWVAEKALQLVLELLPSTQNIAVTFGLPIRFKGKTYNCICFVENGKILGFSAKQFLANDGIHYEPRWFQAWPAGLQDKLEIAGNNYPFGDLVYQIQGKSIAFEICEDAWRENRPGVRYAAQNIDVILNPSASHFAFQKTQQRRKLIIESSKNFNCTYIYANLLGNEAGKIIYDGEILIANKGELLAENDLLSFRDTNLLSCEENSTPVSPKNYSKNNEFQKAVSLALFDYLRKAYTKSFVLSLSGGADSSACAILVALMVRNGLNELGLIEFLTKLNYSTEEIQAFTNDENLEKHVVSKTLLCAYQGTRNSSEDTFNSAKGLADSIGAVFYDWLIDDEVNSYTQKIETVLKRSLDWQTDDLALQNIQARSRSPIIWMLTNISKSLLITTSNRSEGDVGYATMDGDTSGSIAPIAGVDKHFIRQWLIWAQLQLGYTGLQFVNNLQPSAELRPQNSKQTDEDDLMPYDVLAAIEKVAIYEYRSPVEVFQTLFVTEKYDKEQLKGWITKFYRLWSINQWKRERLAPSFHIDDFNVDPRTWCRFPILSGAFRDELKLLHSL